MKAMRAIVAAAAAMVTASGASASTVLTDNFNGENGGATALGYNSFANFTVTKNDVDLIGPGNPYGITCADGSCVDLDGANPGTLTSKLGYAYNVGDMITLTAAISGNQRNSGTDNFFLSLLNGGATLASNSFSANTGATFVNYSVSFTALAAGSVQAQIGSTSGAAVGPVLDDVSLSITPRLAAATPEPGTWAMMIVGCGIAGAALRRRRHVTRAACAA